MKFPSKQSRPYRRYYVAFFVAITLILLAAGYRYYQGEIKLILGDKQEELAAIGKLKSQEIQDWRKAQLHDADKVARDPQVIHDAADLLRNPGSSADRADLQKRLQVETLGNEFQQAILFAPNGRLEASSDPPPSILGEATQRAIAAALTRNESVISDFFREPEGAACLDIAAPVKGADGQPLAVVVLRHAASLGLFPMIQSWPIPSRSGEVLLAQRLGGEAVLLNDLRDQSNTALALSVPMSRTDLPIVQAVLGKRGPFLGKAYRGFEVLANLRRIPDSPWSLVTMEKADDVMAEVRHRALLLSLMVGSLILGLAAATTAHFFRHQQVRLFHDLYQLEFQQREAHEIFRTTLYSIGDGVLTTDSTGLVREMNPVAQKLTGWPEDEAQGEPLNQVFRIINEDTRATVESPVDQVLRKGAVVGLANHTLLITRDGIERPIADSAAPILDESGAISGVVLVFKDQTAERTAQKELRKSEQRLRAIIEAEPECVKLMDSNGQLLEMNPAGLAMLEADSLEEVQNKGLTTFIHPEFHAAFRALHERVMSGESGTLEFEVTGLKGTRRWLDTHAVPLRDANGQVSMLLGISRDITERKNGERKRREADARIREQASLLDKAHDAIMVRDMDHRVLYWNKGAERLYGWTAEEMIGRMPMSMVYDDLGDFQAAQAQVLAKDEWTGSIQQRRKDGCMLTIEAHWTLVRDEQGQPRSILAINTDITERAEAERELKQYTERLKSLREIDAAILGARSTTELVRGALARLRRIVPFERAAVVLFDQNLTEGNVLAVDQNTPWLPLAGEARPIADFHDLKELLSGPFLDLRDLEEVHGCTMEELLLSQGLRDLVYIPMESEGSVLGFLALSAVAPGVLKPEHTEIALDMTDQLVIAIQHMRLKEELELSNQQLESRVEKRTAELRTTVATLQVLEGELRKSEAEARAASEAKSTFLSSMSHELRTPLIGVTGMLEILSQSDLDTQQRRVVSVIHESSESLLQIIGDILDFSKIEAGKLELSPQTFSARALLESISHTFRSAISAKGLNLIMDVDPRLAPAHVADVLRIRQILNNFLSNAVKFTESGAITLRVRRLEARDGHESLAFEVQDTGIGVSPENQAKLFEPFAQAEASTTRRFGGTGLGLAISRRLADLMGGNLSMQSTLGRGTTMTLAVNLHVGDERDIVNPNAPDPSKAMPTRPAPSIEAAEQEHSLILLAEDHPTNRIVLIQQVNRAGFALEVAEDGQEAFERWQSGRHALILTDLHMPRMDGYQLTQAVRDWERAHGRPRTPILALTANAMGGEAERCLELGMDDYLIKPVTIPLLASKLNQWLPHVKLEAQKASAPPSSSAAELLPGLDSQTLLDLCDANVASAQEILSDFIAATKADLVVMQDGLRQKDAPCIARQAHRIKGSASMIGARDLADRATKLEASAKMNAPEWETIQEHLAGIQEALKVLESATN